MLTISVDADCTTRTVQCTRVHVTVLVQDTGSAIQRGSRISLLRKYVIIVYFYLLHPKFGRADGV